MTRDGLRSASVRQRDLPNGTMRDPSRSTNMSAATLHAACQRSSHRFSGDLRKRHHRYRICVAVPAAASPEDSAIVEFHPTAAEFAGIFPRLQRARDPIDGGPVAVAWAPSCWRNVSHHVNGVRSRRSTSYAHQHGARSRGFTFSVAPPTRAPRSVHHRNRPASPPTTSRPSLRGRSTNSGPVRSRRENAGS